MSFFAVHRGPRLDYLLEHDHNAYILASHIANRARWNDDWNPHGFTTGQAFIGDSKKMGMTDRKYRTAKEHLEKYGIATFKATNKGTIATLCESTFSVNSREQNDERKDECPTSRRRAGDEQATTNIHSYTNTQTTPTPNTPEEIKYGDCDVCPNFLTADQWSFLQTIWLTGKLDKKRFPAESLHGILRSNPEFKTDNPKHTESLLANMRAVEGKIGAPSSWFASHMGQATKKPMGPNGKPKAQVKRFVEDKP